MGRAVKGLLGYLTLFRHRFHAREVLAGLFWGESSEDRARSSLNTTLWRLRKVIEPGSIPIGAYLVTTPTGEIGFNSKSDHWIDIEIFEDHIKPILAIPHDYRIRYFTDSGVIGSKEFVSKTYMRFKHLFYSKNEKKPKPIKGLDGIYSLKRLSEMI